MFYGWEIFKRESSGFKELESGVPLVPESMESFTNLKQTIEAMSADVKAKDATIAKLQREIEMSAEDLKSEQDKHALTIARNKELERELEELKLRERGLEKQLDEQGDKHDGEMQEMKSWYENKIQRLQSMLRTLEEAEEMLCAQLGDLEAEAMEQNRRFNAEVASLSQSLALKVQDLSSTQAELDAFRQRDVTIKGMETTDLATQLSKSKCECDELKTSTEFLEGELEKARRQAEYVERELAMMKLLSPLKERQITGEKVRRPIQLCRSESLSLLEKQRKYRFTALAG